MANICAVYDVDETYANKLMNVLNGKKGMPFRTIAFTREEALLAFLENNELNVLVISEQAVTETIRKANIKQIIVLSEEDREYEGEGVKGVYKYQSSENIIREVMSYYVGNYTMSVVKTKIIGIYSPIHHVCKTSFALALAKAYAAKDNTVLYINLEEFSGLGEILPEGGGGNLSDAIYYYKFSEGNLMQHIGELVCNIGNLHYIPPIKCAEDVTAIKTEEWIDFLSRMGADAGYDVIVLDISNAVKEQWRLLDICTKVYLPMREDYISRKKINDFDTYMLAMGKEHVSEMIEKLLLPKDKNMGLEPDFLEKVEWSLLGKYAKEMAIND